MDSSQKQREGNRKPTPFTGGYVTMNFQIRCKMVYALGLGEDVSVWVKEFPSRLEADKWCEESTKASNPMWWGDGNYYSVIGGVGEGE